MRRLAHRWGALVLAASLGLVALPAHANSGPRLGFGGVYGANDLEAGGYPLDAISRTVDPSTATRCPEVPLVAYQGTALRYDRPVRVYQGFVPHLVQLERLVRDVAIEVYGRAPRRLVHAGAYNCRPVRGMPTLLSEHALGNALDVRGFDFGPATSAERLAADLPRALSRSFQVRIEPHWRAEQGTSAVHARFLALLRARLESHVLFRGMLGPSYPGHQNHLHFDMAPWSLVQF